MNRRGMTLVELLITLAVVATVITGVTQALMSFKNSAAMQNYKRMAAGNARTALTLMQHKLQRMGYGIEPGIALDFTWFKELETACNPVGVVAGNDCPAVRDRVDGPDELVFYARDPMYWGANVETADGPEGRAWLVRKVDAEVLVIAVAHGDDYLGKGQILQLVCSGASASSYVTVATTYSAWLAGTTDIEVKLYPAEPGNPFKQSPNVAPCMNDGKARAFKVDRFRYYVSDQLLADGKTLAPFLMLDMGVDRNADGEVDKLDLVPIASDIVDMQVSYLRPEPTVEEVGVSAPLTICSMASFGEGACEDGLRVVDFSTFLADEYATYSYFTSATSSSTREWPDAGNVRGVRVVLTARSTARPSDKEIFEIPKRLNRTSVGPGTAYVFNSAEMVVPVKNMMSSTLSFL